MNKVLNSCLYRVGEALDIHNIDREPGTIFVIGDTGVIAHRMATKLLEIGYPNVRLGTTGSMIHDLDDVGNLGTEIVDFAWDREETYDDALSGVKSVFITIPYEKNWYKHYPAFLKACKKAHVKHYVKLSFYLSAISDDIAVEQVPFVQRHAHADELLRKMIMPDIEHVSQMSYTILYASHYMSNPLVHHLKECHKTNASTALNGVSSCQRGVNYVSPNDVAEVSVRVLLAPHDHYNRAYILIGPSIMSEHDIASIVSKTFATNECSCCNNDAASIDPLPLEHLLYSGIDEPPSILKSNDIETICGHPPESFTTYMSRTDTMSRSELGHEYASKSRTHIHPHIWNV